MGLIYYFDLIGTFVFAISGVLTASEKKFDVFGASVIAFVTAIGGGTLRDILIGDSPVGWIKDLNYLYIIIIAIVISLLFKKRVIQLRNTLFLFDTVGIGVFTIIGVQKSLNFDISPVIAVMMGTISAVFGGVIRDILTNETPLIFRKEIYATPCILGGVLYLMLLHFNVSTQLVSFITALLIIGVRLLAVKKNWALPRIK
ncbi:MAG TPA: trimeric intracellular cation channel family protein [Bacteroidales bacterium]|nr:trimeric intracellular cation channel family protein [Bacteroidales bacterium]